MKISFIIRDEVEEARPLNGRRDDIIVRRKNTQIQFSRWFQLQEKTVEHGIISPS